MSRSPGRLIPRPEVHHFFRTEAPTNFKLGTRMEYEDLYRWQAPWPPKSKVMVAVPHGASDRCWPINWECKVPETPKLVGRLPTPRKIKCTSFKVKRSKIKITTTTNAESKSTPYLPNWKAYKLDIPLELGAWRAASQAVPWPPLYPPLGYSTETVLLIFPFLQTNITVQMRPSEVMGVGWGGQTNFSKKRHCNMYKSFNMHSKIILVLLDRFKHKTQLECVNS